MSFLEVQFPTSVSYNASGGSGWNTTVTPVTSGASQSNQVWANPLGHWDVGFAARTRTEIASVIALHMITQGKTHGFRFKDWADYKHSDNNGSGVVALISGSTYQMSKRYTYSGQTRDRKIQKPVNGTIAIQGGGSYTIDYATGIITKVSGAAPTGWTGEFDCPARFDTDLPDVAALSRSGGDLVLGWPSISIVEIRV